MITLVLAATRAKAQPHIVFFLADDYGFADIGYHVEAYGNSSNKIATPNLDALSSTGIRLENYYIQPVCSPTRATLLTGRYVFHHGVHVPFIDSSRSTLPLNETTLAQRLKSAGYATHAVGKWHLGFRSWNCTPTQRGFDSFFGFYAGSQDYYNHESLCWPGSVVNGCFENTTSDGEAVTGLDFHKNKDVFNSTEYATTIYTTQAEKIINDHAAQYGIGNTKTTTGRVAMSKPLFLYLPHQAVHVGNKPTQLHPEYALDQAPQQYIDEYSWVADVDRRNLSAMVTVMDEAAGNVSRALIAAGMWKDTIFIFSTDNGGPVNEGASNYPLQGGKASLWEGGVKGPGFVTGGDLESLGFQNLPRVSFALHHISDWNPTLCDIVGGCPLTPKTSEDDNFAFDGVSQMGALMLGTNASTESNRTEIVHDLCVAWMGGSCLEHLAKIWPHNTSWPSNAMYASILKDGWKLTVGNNKNVKGAAFTPELYHIGLRDDVIDVGEQHDVAASNAGKVAELMKSLNMHLVGAGVAHDRDPIDPRSNPELHDGSWMPWLTEDEL